MSETNKKTDQTSKSAEAKDSRAAAKKTYSKEVVDRAKKIQTVRKAEEVKKATAERKERMAKRAEAKKKAEVAKQKAMEKKAAEQQKTTTNSEAKEPAKVKEALELVDFAVTARKYKTQLTRKYQERKFWENPSPFEILSYIPGTIISIDVKEGKVIQEGTQLLILEAMKMQNRVDMPFTARIKKINVKTGERIPKDFVMIELEAVDK